MREAWGSTKEEMPPREGETRAMNVSTIEITLTKEAKPNEEAKATLEIQAHTTEATKELV